MVCVLQVTGDDGVITRVTEILGGGSADKVLTSISTSSGSTGSSSSSGTSSSSSSSSSSTATGGGGDAYGEETGTYDGTYDGYGNYETYYDEATASPDGDTTRRVTITSTSIGTGGGLDLGGGASIDLGAGTGGRVITSGGTITISSNKTSVR